MMGVLTVVYSSLVCKENAVTSLQGYRYINMSVIYANIIDYI